MKITKFNLFINYYAWTKRDYFFNHVSINSKATKKNNLFIAIKGKKNDGHNFLNEAIKNGANHCIVSKSSKKKSKFALFWVKNFEKPWKIWNCCVVAFFMPNLKSKTLLNKI